MPTLKRAEMKSPFLAEALEVGDYLQSIVHYANAGASGVLFAVSIFLLLPEALLENFGQLWWLTCFGISGGLLVEK